LDSYALLAYLNKEPGFEAVRKALSRAEESRRLLFMNEINIGEVYYILQRKRGKEKAEYFLSVILESLPIQKISNSLETVIAAAKIKADFPLSYSDCFAIETALRKQAVILTGDPEFHNVEHIVDIEWLK
jgi:ribonuclease VapC